MNVMIGSQVKLNIINNFTMVKIQRDCLEEGLLLKNIEIRKNKVNIRNIRNK